VGVVHFLCGKAIFGELLLCLKSNNVHVESCNFFCCSFETQLDTGPTRLFYVWHQSLLTALGKSVLALTQDYSSELNFCCSPFMVFWFIQQVDLGSYMDETKPGYLPQPLVDAQFTGPV